MRLLVTRPDIEAQRTAQALRAAGHEALLAPLLRIENDAGVRIGAGPWSAALMTSGNAARAIAAHPQRAALTSLRCLAVGHQTAQAAKAAGFADVVSADGDGGDLAALAAQELGTQPAPLLYLAGDDRARDMAADLAPSGLRVDTVVVYRAKAAAAFAPDIVALLKSGGIDGALHYSRRSTAIFVACAKAGGVAEPAARLAHYCLSARAAEPLTQIAANRVFVAARPDEAAILNLIPLS